MLRLVTLSFLAGAAMLVGCTSRPSPAASTHNPDQPDRAPVISEPAPAAKPEAAPEPRVAPAPAPPPSHKKTGAEHNRREPVLPEAPVLQPGEYALTVESEPPGMTVVVNGKPCGKTPCTVVVQANGRGFLREQVSIKVRFVAADESEESQTVEEVLTTLDKVPSGVRFTQAGALRVVR